MKLVKSTLTVQAVTRGISAPSPAWTYFLFGFEADSSHVTLVWRPATQHLEDLLFWAQSPLEALSADVTPLSAHRHLLLHKEAV